ncbi:polysaccharide lyase 8 family protein [Streptomyces ziwulingensis]
MTSLWPSRRPLRPTRRAVLLTAALAAALTPAPAARAAADPYDALRRRWTDLALGTGYDPAAEPYAARLAETGRLARAHRAAMAPAPGSLWPGHPFDPPAGITFSYGRLWTMTQAYAQQGTGCTGDETLLADVLRGLDHLAATVYHPGTTRYGNWWEWQIGSPRLLTDITAVLHEHLGAERIAAACAAVDHFVPDAMLGDYTGTSTGANRVDLCRSVALRGVLGRAPAKIALARDALSPVFPYVTEGDGLYADGSYLQHTWVAYSGTYGQVLLDGLGRLFTLLAGSEWEVRDPARQIVLDSVEHAFAPLIHDGLAMDCVNGRAISRGLSKSEDRPLLRGDHFHGQQIIAAVAVLAGGASPAERDRWHALIKGWIERSAQAADSGRAGEVASRGRAAEAVSPILTAPQFGVADLARLRAVADSPVRTAPEPVGHRLFAAMDRAVHRRPGFTAALAMASDRIAHYECGNGENPRGWHTGAGMLSWWPAGTRTDQYTDWFWPTVDWYRLPGTTVSTRRLADRAGGEWGAARPDARAVGGTTDGTYAVVSQHLKGLGSTLQARKSWFFLDDRVVCLGAGITCADGVPVETVVDNRNLGEAGTAAFTRGHDWAHLEGHGGWIVLDGDLRALREDRTGAWSDINTGSSTERRTRRWQTLWLDHGTDPADAAYAYAVLPGASRRVTARRAVDRRRLRILANDPGCQAVAVPARGLTAAAFWRAGTVGPLTAPAGTSVLVRRRHRTATLHISEFTRMGEPLEIVWDRPVRAPVRADSTVEILSTAPRLRLRVAPGTVGATHECEVALR